MTFRAGCLSALGLALLLGCDRSKKTGGASAGAASGASSLGTGPGARPPGRAAELSKAEARRDSKAVSSNDLTSRDPELRRIAARALSRIADARAAELLTRSLADEDAEVMTWSAYGLGFACRGREPNTVRALAVRAASLSQVSGAPKPLPGGLFSPVEAIADALARCGTPDAERTLRAWLEGPRTRAEAAALALGRLAAKHGRLEDASLVALLDAAGRPEAPLGQALYAFTRLPGVGEPVRSRLLEIAKTALGAPGPRRAFAVRALGQAGVAAAPELRAVLESTTRTAGERADAARELSRLGEPGQVALGGALDAFVSQLLGSDSNLLKAEYGSLLRLLQSLTPPLREARKPLERLADLPLGDGDVPELRRRKVALRCRAAGLLAGRATLSQRLRECDPQANGRIGALAVVEVLDRGQLTGARGQRFRSLATTGDPIVRAAALALLGSHPEVEGAFALLAAALGEKQPGIVISAAKVLATYPDRAEEPDGAERGREKTGALLRPSSLKPHAKVIGALTTALEAAQASPNVELRAALMDAAASLQLLGVKPALEKNCNSPNATLRSHAEASLRVLGDRDRRCVDFAPDEGQVSSARTPNAATIRFTTALGELSIELTADLAPRAVSRFVELAGAGFYDGMVIHRVVPGFVVQFGDPLGDGYGGSGKPLLPCETSPIAFSKNSVGVALSGRDTGDSQFFVTLGEYPHLSGEYALVGKAAGAWDLLSEGDVIQKAVVVR